MTAANRDRSRLPFTPSPHHPITPSLFDFSTSRLLDLALAEDIGGDITSTLTVAAGRQAQGRLLAKAAGIVSGLDVAGKVFRRVDPSVVFTPLVIDGEAVAAMTPIATIEGPARSLLAGERVALNLLQRLSGVATLTARYVEAVRETRARIVDTRKTTPGLRAGEGGGASRRGHNHRFGLTDGVLIKTTIWRRSVARIAWRARSVWRGRGRHTPCASRSK